jgi:hypothetical protein
MRIATVVLTLALAGAAALAQQSVPPPPKPANDAPANAEVMMLLRAGMPESVVLDKIHAISGKFDTSTTALITLKQAGATEAELKAVMAQGAASADSQSATVPNPSSPTLAESLKFIQDKVNQQGSIAYVESANNTLTEEIIPPGQQSVESHVVSVDPAGGLSLQNSMNLINSAQVTSLKWEFAWQVYFKDIDKLEVMNSVDYKHRKSPERVYQEDPPYFELVVHLADGKTVQQHRTFTSNNQVNPAVTRPHARPSANTFLNNFFKDSDISIQEFVLHFRDEETANRVAKAMIHAIELCGGGSKPEPF